ncbi:uncharacterized protein LOC128259221 [Drosophila gunungcola]|uniref:uncharacterized protein LOC121467585 n=1 Tax=Drosophila elegans TaxID=30023 RepID=UPI001BC8452D|nr:uncharacterized protein LOC121467585 [Drosophila elegans]XP_052847434.1 uncharacterized protein LOC128259221 [Drosophila gunungcola]
MKFFALIVFLIIALVAVKAVPDSPSFLKCLDEISDPELCLNFKDQFPEDAPAVPVDDYTFEASSG